MGRKHKILFEVEDDYDYELKIGHEFGKDLHLPNKNGYTYEGYEIDWSQESMLVAMEIAYDNGIKNIFDLKRFNCIINFQKYSVNKNKNGLIIKKI